MPATYVLTRGSAGPGPTAAESKNLTLDERVNWFPHLSPDGTRAVYVSYPPGTTVHSADLPIELRLVDRVTTARIRQSAG